MVGCWGYDTTMRLSQYLGLGMFFGQSVQKYPETVFVIFDLFLVIISFKNTAKFTLRVRENAKSLSIL
jgi:hypothetical protein